MILILDNLDSFTFNLVDYFNQLGLEVKVFRNDVPMESILEYDYSGVVLSPGPENPAKAGNLMQVIEHYSGVLPLLGICLGHQAIGQYFGANLEKALRPMHGKVSRVEHRGGLMFGNLPPRFDVVRYHSLILNNLPDSLRPTAFSQEGEIMGFENRELGLAGLQFHPEAALTEHGMTMLSNWISFNNISD